jgi:predicted amidohydrolase YtcJ
MLSGGADVPPTAREAELLAPNRDRVRIGAIKLLQDGSLQGYTGYLTAPYHHQPEGHSADDRGYPARSREALIEAVNRYHRGGYQIAIHGNGDAAIDDILRPLPPPNPRRLTRRDIGSSIARRRARIKSTG